MNGLPSERLAIITSANHGYKPQDKKTKTEREDLFKTILMSDDGFIGFMKHIKKSANKRKD